MRPTLLRLTSAAALAATAALGFTPPVEAKGKSVPDAVCVGPEIFHDRCRTQIPRTGPVNIVAPKWKVRTPPDTACVRSIIPPKQPDLPDCQLDDLAG